MLDSFFSHSILKRAIEKKKIVVHVHDIRTYSKDKHKKVDDRKILAASSLSPLGERVG